MRGKHAASLHMSGSEDTFFQGMKGEVETDRDLVLMHLDVALMCSTTKKDLSHKNTDQSIKVF